MKLLANDSEKSLNPVESRNDNKSDEEVKVVQDEDEVMNTQV